TADLFSRHSTAPGSLPSARSRPWPRGWHHPAVKAFGALIAGFRAPSIPHTRQQPRRFPPSKHGRAQAGRGRMLPKQGLVAALMVAWLAPSAASAAGEKRGGTMHMYIWDNPPSASIHEEATVSTVMPFMALFNNLVVSDQQQPLNAVDTIRPELATSWSWDETKTRLTFQLRTDVTWHDGKPFTADDVVCTFDKLQEKSADSFRKNPRKIWWHNLEATHRNGEHEVTFQLKRPQA